MNYAEDDSPRPIVEHLLELRNRLLRCVGVILVAFIACLPYSQEIYELLAAPLQAQLPGGMIATEVAAPLLAPLKLCFFVAFCIAVPYVLKQFWGFVAPGLYLKEARLMLPILSSSVLLFFAGIAFAYFVVFPIAFTFFVSVAPEGVQVMTDINAYLNFVIKLFFAFGLAFEMPVLILVLVRGGVVSHASLVAKRPYIVVGCFIVGMFMTPPDIFSQALLAVPMWILFELGLLITRNVGDSSEGEEDEGEEDGDAQEDTKPPAGVLLGLLAGSVLGLLIGAVVVILAFPYWFPSL